MSSVHLSIVHYIVSHLQDSRYKDRGTHMSSVHLSIVDYIVSHLQDSRYKERGTHEFCTPEYSRLYSITSTG